MDSMEANLDNEGNVPSPAPNTDSQNEVDESSEMIVDDDSHEVIDLTADDSDASDGSDASVGSYVGTYYQGNSPEFRSPSPILRSIRRENRFAGIAREDVDLDVSTTNVDVQSFNFNTWDGNEEQYHLWNSNEEFRQMALPFVEIAKLYGQSCVSTCQRAYNRDPTILEFCNYVASKTVPRQSWVGNWVLVNSERRGWPLQYSVRAEVMVNCLTFTTGWSNPDIDFQVLKKYDSTNSSDSSALPRILNVWQLDPLRPGDDFYVDGLSIEDGKKSLELIRKLVDVVWYPSDPEELITFFNMVLYERLVLLFRIENPSSPSLGRLCDSDRGRIIAAIKNYHYLRNALPDDANDCDEEEVNVLKFRMLIEKQKFEINYLLSEKLRPLLPAMTSSCNCNEDETLDVYNFILVMRETNMNDLMHTYEQLREYGLMQPDSNIKVCSDLEWALKKCSPGTTVFVTSGNYCLSGLWKLSDGGSIIGIKTSNSDVTVIPADSVGDIWLLLDGLKDASLTLKNLNFVIDTTTDNRLETLIYVSTGKLIMENCVLRNNNPDSNLKLISGIKKSDAALIEKTRCTFTRVKEDCTDCPDIAEAD